jgi:membrane-associated protease RseP (regulator of RpoE activity)
MSLPENETLTNLVSRVFRIEDMTMNPQKGFMMRYRGELLQEDSAVAYDQLAESMRPHGITPLFRVEDGRQVIYLAPAMPEPVQDNPSTNIILFLLTVLSVLLAGVEVPIELCTDQLAAILYMLRNILTGWPFAVSMLGILLAHEFGHYFMSRYHKTPATLPFFLPLPPPLSPLGTLGAAIIMRATPKNKRILFDIGVAGPIAGLIVAIPVLLYGLSISELHPLTMTQCGVGLEGNSILYLGAKYLTFGQLLPAPVEPQDLLYWLRFFFTGGPIPLGGTDVFIHSVAFAGWAGILVTALNLLPVGTLDGGHVVYGLFGDRARKAFPFIVGLLLVLGIFWMGWWIWAMLLFWLGRVHAEPLDQITSLDAPRRGLAILMILVFILVFMPVPFSVLLP